jgi:hypothetical protein
MAATIKIKNSSTASAVPTSSDLVQGELAVNVTDKRIFTENASGTVVELGTNPTILTMGAAGSASAPVITRTGDTNTGIFFPAADTIAFAEGGVEAMRLDSSGNLGLGVTPSAWATLKGLDISSFGGLFGYTNQTGIIGNAYYGSNWTYKTTGLATYYSQENDGAHKWFRAASGTAGTTVSWTQAMTLDASGNLGVGTTSPSRRLDVRGGSGIQVNEDGSGTKVITIRSDFAGVDPAINVTTNNALLLMTNNTERARIDSSGNLLVGTTSTSGTSGVGVKTLVSATAPDIAVVGSSTSSGDVGFQLYSTGASAYRFYVAYNGTISATSTTISAISDIRFKENVRDLDAGLAEVMALKPRLYDWKEGKGADIKNARGFIAQEFEEVFPDLIDEWRDPAPEGEEPYKSVRADLIPVLVKAIQELKAEFDAYKASHP